ncbi:hypothetical protein [Actinospongicola halichondriae]|uniref:hypothetical protein n=1 Tax=Actinospongicola halichondriae TaxID=3236844 RepID=UPI003D5CF504
MPRLAHRLVALWCVCALLAGVYSAAIHDAETTTATTASDDASGTTTTRDLDQSSTSTPDGAGDVSETTDTAPLTTAAPATSSPPSSPPTSSTTTPVAEEDARGTAPGSYVYDTTGTANGEDVSGTSTLEVSPVGDDGRQTHVQSAPDGTTTTIYRHADEGTFLESLAVESDEGSFTLEATSPFLLVPADATVGTKTTGTLRGDDITADVTFAITAIDSATTTAMLDVDLRGKIRGFDVEGTMQSAIVARRPDQLPIEVDATSDVVVGGGLFRIESDTHSVLRR